MSLHLVLIYILQILEDYKLMRQIDDSALTELIQNHIYKQYVVYVSFIIYRKISFTDDKVVIVFYKQNTCTVCLFNK